MFYYKILRLAPIAIKKRRKLYIYIQKIIFPHPHYTYLVSVHFIHTCQIGFENKP